MEILFGIMEFSAIVPRDCAHFQLFELGRSLTHSIDTSPNVDATVKTEALGAVKQTLTNWVCW